MGVIFTNGLGVGTVPSVFGGSNKWLLAVGGYGYQPAWDNGTISFPIHPANSGSNDPTDVLTTPGGIYINGLDSLGNNKNSLLMSAIGTSGTITFTQGATQAIFLFDDTTFGENTYSNPSGIFHENISGSNLTLLSSQNLPFVGYNGSGTPNNNQLITVTLNVSTSFTLTADSFDVNAGYGSVCGSNEGSWNSNFSGFTVNNAVSNLWCGVWAHVSGNTITQIQDAFTAVGATQSWGGYIFDVVWGSGSTVTNGVVKISFINGSNQINITTVDPTDTAYLNNDNNANNGTSLAGTFNFPATFTFRQPLDLKGGWC